MGSHQPPTNRSFYLSLAASTLRFATGPFTQAADVARLAEVEHREYCQADDAGKASDRAEIQEYVFDVTQCAE